MMTMKMIVGEVFLCCEWKVDDMKYDMRKVNKRKPIITWQVTYLIV